MLAKTTLIQGTCPHSRSRFGLHGVVFVADPPDVILVADHSDVYVCTKLFFPDVSVCTTLFFSSVSVCTTFRAATYLQGCISVIFVADFSDVSVCMFF